MLTLPCDSTWPINSSAVEMRQAGWPEQVDRLLRDTLEKADDFHPWVLMAWLESKEGTAAEAETKLRIVRRVTEIHARYAQAYDVMAELLTRLGRHDDALRACHPKPWGDGPPLILRGRAAWISWQRGDRAAAIARMREIVATDPDYYWGWQQLANWYDEEDATADYLEATEQLVRLGPTDPSAYGYRGEARAAAGDRRGAKSDYRRAFELDPAYAFAGISLFDTLVSDDELDEADRTLARLEEHVGGPHVQLRALRLRCLRKDREGAKSAFRTLIAEVDAPPFVITKAASAMTDAGYASDVDEAVAAEIEGALSPPVARLFVERAAGRADWSFLERLPVLIQRGEGGREVLYSTVDALAAPSQRARLHDVLERFGDQIRQTQRGWAKAAGALMSVRDYAAVATWCADWESRKPDEPWMLHPLALSLRQLGRPADANPVVKYALGLAVEDAATPDFRVWAAFEEAIAGYPDRAESLLDGVEDEDLDDVPRVLCAFTRSLIALRRKGATAFTEARERGRQAVREFAPKERDADIALSYQRWAKRLARDAGGIGPWVWAVFQGKRLP